MKRLAVTAVLLSLPIAAAAQGPQREPLPDFRGTLSLTVENDVFGGGSDRYYTNGLLLSWQSPNAALPWPLAGLDRQFDFLLGPGDLRWGLSAGQTIHTPEDTNRRIPDRRDRPYAGHLYGALSLVRTSTGTGPTGQGRGVDTQSLVELQLGVVGPSALGEFVQNNWHDLLGVRNAEGWDRQLKDEPAVGLIVQRQWRIPTGTVAGIEADAIPSLTVSLGNVRTYAAAGGLLRVGSGLAADWGPVRLRPAVAGSSFFQPRQEFGWYAFAGVEGRAVLRDIFLDGNTWRDGPSVDRRPFVGDAQAGVAVLWRGVRFAYTQVLRTEEFYGQRGRQSFGSFSVSARF